MGIWDAWFLGLTVVPNDFTSCSNKFLTQCLFVANLVYEMTIYLDYSLLL